jgi:Mg-chelatase subunit ChlD
MIDHQQKDEARANVVVLITDGEENESRTPFLRVEREVKELTERGWKFVYVGPKQDYARSLGFVECADFGERTLVALEAQLATFLTTFKVRGELPPFFET